jgi:hypothetical protein
MRLQEIFTDDEWQRLEQLIYTSAYKALTAYQQHRATAGRVQQIATKPTATLKPQATKKSKALARKAKRPPHASPPKPLPTPKPIPQARAEATPAYRPVKTVKQLTPTTRMAMAKAQPRAAQPVPNKSAPQSITDPNHIDQAARRILPPDKRGPNPIDIISP